MGCDIHAVLQVSDGHGCWISLPPIPFHRNYNLFALLAGVRNQHNIKPMSEPRGVPDDFFSDYYDAWHNPECSDAHNDSWLATEEFRAIEGDAPFGNGQTVRNAVGWEAFQLIEWLAEIPNGRLVFWFDN